ncbi:MAG: hypothetical protein RIT40_701 [Planctomycetota bacterium]
MTQLAALLFDIDDTLVPTTEFARRARTNAVRAMISAGLELPEELVLRELDEVLHEFSSNYEHHFDKLLMRLRPKSLERVNPALVVAAGVAAYHDTKFLELAPFDDVYPLFRDLKRAGVRLGIVTHGWTVKQAEKLVRLGLIPYLDAKAVFISDQIGISKPNPKLYQLALTDMGLPAEQVMYIGDNPEHDLVPPHAIGMRTVWARRASRHRHEAPNPAADHVIDSFDELRPILKRVYGVPLN